MIFSSITSLWLQELLFLLLQYQLESSMKTMELLTSKCMNCIYEVYAICSSQLQAEYINYTRLRFI